ncbi:hypothetical protein [Trinickia mobilis]|uniref:hypothetical protein n=1 Tax=Trinickia mobilis TaxID=2816356 RepID=UPI001A8F6116|nr:hypothetical protein [Trinickia mobilis]
MISILICSAQPSTVGAKTPQALRDIPQTVTVINEAGLESQDATSAVRLNAFAQDMGSGRESWRRSARA